MRTISTCRKSGRLLNGVTVNFRNAVNQGPVQGQLAALNYDGWMTTMRRPRPSEYGSVRALIETVANETFRDLFAPNPVPLEFEDEDWPLAWVAVSDERIVGVIITNQEWVGDLWVFREHRRQGIGSKLLAQGEAEISARGHQTCRLRVVRSNAVTVEFYLSHGWKIAREFAHEKYHHPMLELAKSLPGRCGELITN